MDEITGGVGFKYSECRECRHPDAQCIFLLLIFALACVLLSYVIIQSAVMYDPAQNNKIANYKLS